MTPPDRMSVPEKTRLRAAAFRATRLYPGPVGELLSRELLTWEEFGYRFGGSSLILLVVDHILKSQIDGMPPSLHVNRPAGQSAVGY